MSEWKDRVAACSPEAQALIQCVEDDFRHNREKLIHAVAEIRRLSCEGKTERDSHLRSLSNILWLSDGRVDTIQEIRRYCKNKLQEMETVSEGLAPDE